MKILMFAPNFYPHIGGVEKHIMKASEELYNKGHEITIITVKENPKYSDNEVINNINILRMPNTTLPHIWLWIMHHSNLIKESDIIHCHDFITFYWYFPFRFIFHSKPVFITFHGFEGEIPIQGRILFLRKVSEKLTHGNICIGHYIPKWYGTKPTYISYGGVDCQDNPNCATNEECNEAAFIGRLEKDTGILHYISAIEILTNDYGMNIKLNVCGDGSLRNAIEKKIMEKKLNVELYGFVDNPTPILTRSRFAFVSGYLAILEALCNKKIVFTIYDNEIKKDYLMMMPKSDRIMVITSSAEELAFKIRKMIENPRESEEIIKNGYDFANNQTWESVSKTYLRLWNRGELIE